MVVPHAQHSLVYTIIPLIPKILSPNEPQTPCYRGFLGHRLGRRQKTRAVAGNGKQTLPDHEIHLKESAQRTMVGRLASTTRDGPHRLNNKQR